MRVGELLAALCDDSGDVRRRDTIPALIQLGHAAVPALRAAVSAGDTDSAGGADGRVRAGAAYALARIDAAQTPVAVDALVALLGPPHPHARADAAWALGQLGRPASRALPALVAALWDSASGEETQFYCAAALPRIGAHSAEAVPALAAALRHPARWVRVRAADALRTWRPREAEARSALPAEDAATLRRAVPALAAALRDAGETPLARTHAAYALASLRVPPSAVLPVLLETLRGPAWWLRAYAARALATMGSRADGAVATLTDALGDPEVVVWRNACFALAELGPAAEPAVPVLLPFLERSDRAGLAAEALARVGAAAVPALVGAVRSGGGSAARYAAYAITIMTPAEAPGAKDARQEVERSGVEPYRPAWDEFDLRAPDIDVGLDVGKAAAFERLLEDGDGRRVDYGLPYPKHEFFAYAVQRGHLLHGSSDGGIDRFEPRWQTDGRGRPVKRTFATHHAVWPMYFAVLERSRVYSLRNGPSLRRDADGVRRTYYHFTIDTESLLAAPFVRGTVYVLPAETYERTEGYEPEWMSPVPVRPVARVPVAPDDFPFLREIWGNDWRMGTGYPRLDVFPWVNHARIFPVRPQRSGP